MSGKGSTVNDPFACLYSPDGRDEAVFGKDYKPPKTFEHYKEALVCKLSRPSDSDGHPVEIYETRLPARFFRLVALPSKNSIGEHRKGFEITTSSGDEIGRLIYLLGKQIVRGMISVRELPKNKKGDSNG